MLAPGPRWQVTHALDSPPTAELEHVCSCSRVGGQRRGGGWDVYAWTSSLVDVAFLHDSMMQNGLAHDEQSLQLELPWRRSLDGILKAIPMKTSTSTLQTNPLRHDDY